MFGFQCSTPPRRALQNGSFSHQERFSPPEKVYVWLCFGTFFCWSMCDRFGAQDPSGSFRLTVRRPPAPGYAGAYGTPYGYGVPSGYVPSSARDLWAGEFGSSFPDRHPFHVFPQRFFSPQAIYISPPPKLRLRKSSRPEVEVEAIFFIQKTYHPAPARAPFWCHCHEPSRGCCQRPGCQLPTPHPTEAPPHMPPPTQAPTRTLLGLLHQWVPTRTTTPPSGTTASMAQPATPMPVFLGVRPWIDCVSRARDAGSANACKF